MVITISVIKVITMTRYIPQWLSPVVEALELDRPDVVTMAELTSIAEESGVGAQGYAISDRLRKLGWLALPRQEGESISPIE